MCFGKGDEKFGIGGFAFYPDGAAVELHHPLDHRQADAVALAVVGTVRLVELAENGFLLLRGNIGAGVAF